MKNKKTIVIPVIMLIIILGLSITYAWASQTTISDKIQSIIVGNFKFSLTEENSLTLPSAEFISDDKGMMKDGFKFIVENTGQFTGSYSVYLDDDSIPAGTTRLEDKFIKYSLEINGNKYNPMELNNRKIYDGILNRGEKDTIILRLWLNKDVNGDIGGQTFKAKVRIEANQQPSIDQTTNITYDYNYLVNDKFDEYYDTSNFYPCCETAISLTSYKTYYDGIGRVFLVTANKNKVNRGWYFFNKKALTIDKTYTYIFEARSNVALTAMIGSEQEGTTGQIGNIKYSLTSEYKRYTRTFKIKNVVDGNYYRAFIFYDWTSTEDRTLEIRNLQIQEGGLSVAEIVKMKGTNLYTFPYLKRDNYQLLGWYTDPVNGDKIDENTIVPSTDTTYYAHWKYIGEK